MLGMCARKSTGAVGCKIFYKKKLIEHAGVVTGVDDFYMNLFKNMRKAENSYYNRSDTQMDYSAISGLCFMVEKKAFEKVSRFDEKLKEKASVIDLCLKFPNLHLYFHLCFVQNHKPQHMDYTQKGIAVKIIVVFGTRPEAIKMCPLIKEIKRRKNVNCIVCVTGQHKEMLDQVLDVFKITPDYNFSIMKKNQTLYDITYLVMEGMKKVLKQEKPDVVLVHGDTTTTFAAALACFYEKIPVGHVEAGLRTYNIYSPFPEEFNRQAVDIVSSYYFAPTERSRQNLLKEGKDVSKIYVTGNTAIDALKTTVSRECNLEWKSWSENNRLLLLTAHRRENLGKPLENIFEAIKEIVEKYDDVKVIYPIHYNPQVREFANKILGEEERVKLIDPLNVVEFHNLINISYMILTDSGGIQEEAPSLGKPVLVLRDTTERPEGVEAGTLKLVGTNKDRIRREVEKLLNDEVEYKKMSDTANPYGDGNASKRIVDILLKKGDGIYG